MPTAVELLVYSGRPNPRVALDRSTEAELVRRVSALERSTQTFSPGDGLGYRGLHVFGVSDSTVGEVEINAGMVSAHDRQGRTRTFVDPNRTLERWLLGVVRAFADAADQSLVDEILRQVETQRRIAAPGQRSTESQMMANAREQTPGVLGTWTKTTTASCADKYPATLTFSSGTYRGTRGPAQGMVWWDAGIYRIENANTLVIATATDELLTYRLNLEGDRFEVTDSDGCHVSYRRG